MTGNPMEVVVVPTGAANIASVLAGLRRVGGEGVVSEERTRVEEAERVVLPGVGAFGAAMQRLRDDGLVDVLRARVGGGRPTLAICCGMQLLFESSEESDGVEGLACIPGRARRFDSPRVPQLGWNRIEADPDARVLSSGYAYFANSYRVGERLDGWACATCDYAGPFVAAIERGAVVACQFHPELSGAFGLSIVRRWMEFSREAARC